MPSVRPLVDVEALVVAALTVDAELGALAAGVASELPAGFPSSGRSFVQLFRATATSVDPATGHVERAVLQTSFYGSSKGAAWDVTAAAYAALLELVGSHPLGVVTDVVRLSGPSWSPDPMTDAPRYTASFAVTVHPAA